MRALLTLDSDKLTVQEITREAKVSQAWLSQTLNALIFDGYVEEKSKSRRTTRHPHSHVLYAVTQKGRQYLEEAVRLDDEYTRLIANAILKLHRLDRDQLYSRPIGQKAGVPRECVEPIIRKFRNAGWVKSLGGTRGARKYEVTAEGDEGLKQYNHHSLVKEQKPEAPAPKNDAPAPPANNSAIAIAEAMLDLAKGDPNRWIPRSEIMEQITGNKSAASHELRVMVAQNLLKAYGLSEKRYKFTPEGQLYCNKILSAKRKLNS